MIIDKPGMCWAGRIENLSPIVGADAIQRADVVCGPGGKWSGVVKMDAYVGEPVAVFLQDSIVPNTPATAFMEKHQWRVRMMRLRGCPSECLIVPLAAFGFDLRHLCPGDDLTSDLGVKKFEKEIPACIAGEVEGPFPNFLRKTDETNFQKAPHLVESVIGKPIYIATKYDGTSQTFFRFGERFGLCSRNLELKYSPAVAGWKLVDQYGLREKMATIGNIALQWECVGPGIQGNPLKLKQVELRLFDAYDIDSKQYFGHDQLTRLAAELGIPMAEHFVTQWDAPLSPDELRALAGGVYAESKKTREGIVIRPLDPFWVGAERVSFKVINLDYKEA